MDTKLKGDIAEQAAILKALKNKWEVLKPIGDRLPYDLVFVVNNNFYKIQIKSAWPSTKNERYLVDTRRSKTNRKIYKIEPYSLTDFDFALCYIPKIDIFYIFPVVVFIEYKSTITLETPLDCNYNSKSSKFREAWDIIT